VASNLWRRLGRLEAVQGASLCGGVVLFDHLHETPQEAANRAGRAGVIIMPVPRTPTEWQSATVAAQIRLLRRAAAYAHAGIDPGD